MANPLAAAADRVRIEASYYRGAAYDRLNADWYMWRLSADQAMRFDLQTLRSRSRELVANNSTATAIPRILAENIVGKDGIILQCQVESTRGNLNKDVCARIEDAWAEWGEDGNCSTDGQGGFIDLQRLWVETECIDGEVILYPVDGYDNKWGFAIDTIDADQLDHLYTVAGSDQTNAVRMGVETDKWHRPVGYWMWTSHPSEPDGKTRIRVDASRLQHVYVQIRPKATRGLPWLSPVIFDLNMMGGYRDAEITAARVAASAMGFFTQGPDSPGAMTPTDGSKELRMHAEPGLMRQLPPDMKFEAWTPQHPNTAFEKFDQAIIRSISTAQRVSYMSLSNDLSATSFASGRIGLLAERAVFQFHQQRVIRRVLTPLYRRWLKMAMLSGALRLPSMNPAAYYAVGWHPRPFPWIDPTKDIDLAERSVGMGIDSLTRLCAEQGRSFEDVLKERAEEIKLAEQYDVPLVIAAGRAKPINIDTTEEAEADKATDAAPQNGTGKKKPAPASRNGRGGSNGNGAHGRIPLLR